MDDPQTVHQIASVRAACDQARNDGKRVALVPTMGALHDGHLSLVEEAQKRGDFVVVTIFVNPTQFGPGEDFDCYPRDLESDKKKLAGYKVDLIFAPSKNEMYPSDFAATVSVGRLTEGLCGSSRPGHFDGVTTVVSKLFNVIGPCVGIFGRKDFQQLQVIRKMVRDLDMPIEIVGAPIFREPDGLAMSSRNAYLSKEDRNRALALSRGLKAAHTLYKNGQRQVGPLRRAVAEPVEATADAVDYVTAADPDTLAILEDDTQMSDRMLIAIAVKIGATRLIDNTVIGS